MQEIGVGGNDPPKITFSVSLQPNLERRGCSVDLIEFREKLATKFLQVNLSVTAQVIDEVLDKACQPHKLSVIAFVLRGRISELIPGIRAFQAELTGSTSDHRLYVVKRRSSCQLRNS